MEKYQKRNLFDIFDVIPPDLDQRLDNIDRELKRIFHLLQKQERQIEHMAYDFTTLEAAVAEETTVTQSAITLINGIADQIAAAVAAANADPAVQAQIQGYADQLKSTADSLSAAVQANTPAANTTPTV